MWGCAGDGVTEGYLCTKQKGLCNSWYDAEGRASTAAVRNALWLQPNGCKAKGSPCLVLDKQSSKLYLRLCEYDDERVRFSHAALITRRFLVLGTPT